MDRVVCRVSDRVLQCEPMSHISVRLDTDLEEMLDRYAQRHTLENRSQALRHALRSILNLEEGESVILKPAHDKRPTVQPRPVPPTSTSGSMKDRASKRSPKRYTQAEIDAYQDKIDTHDRLEGQKLIDRVLKAPKPEPAVQDEEDEGEDEGEYFERIRRENVRKAQGVGPEEWPA